MAASSVQRSNTRAPSWYDLPYDFIFDKLFMSFDCHERAKICGTNKEFRSFCMSSWHIDECKRQLEIADRIEKIARKSADFKQRGHMSIRLVTGQFNDTSIRIASIDFRLCASEVEAYRHIKRTQFDGKSEGYSNSSYIVMRFPPPLGLFEQDTFGWLLDVPEQHRRVYNRDVTYWHWDEESELKLLLRGQEMRAIVNGVRMLTETGKGRLISFINNHNQNYRCIPDLSEMKMDFDTFVFETTLCALVWGQGHGTEMGYKLRYIANEDDDDIPVDTDTLSLTFLHIQYERTRLE
jgi:hypothetical protein